MLAFKSVELAGSSIFAGAEKGRFERGRNKISNEKGADSRGLTRGGEGERAVGSEGIKRRAGRVGPFSVRSNRYESRRYKLAVGSDAMAIYGTILREDSSNRREYRYGMFSHPPTLALPLFPSRYSLLPPAPSPCSAHPCVRLLSSATSQLGECSREGQRSLRGFSEIWRLKPPVGLVATRFAGAVAKKRIDRSWATCQVR